MGVAKFLPEMGPRARFGGVAVEFVGRRENVVRRRASENVASVTKPAAPSVKAAGVAVSQRHQYCVIAWRVGVTNWCHQLLGERRACFALTGAAGDPTRNARYSVASLAPQRRRSISTGNVLCPSWGI